MPNVSVVERDGLGAIARSDARVLILGTLPGAVSLERGEYYAQPRNAFWPIMGKLVGAWPDVPYASRIGQLVDHGIALWDVCAAAHRLGSLDSAIRLSTLAVNDFSALFTIHTCVGRICFNGAKAAEIYRRKVLPNLPLAIRAIHQEVLPSTSSANTAMAFEEKVVRWHRVLSGISKIARSGDVRVLRREADAAPD